MLSRQALRAGLRAWRPAVGAIHRSFATEAGAAVPAEDVESAEFLKKWASVAPNLDKPRFPHTYMKARSTRTDIPAKLTLNFILPYKFQIEAKEVDMVIIPATSGQMGVLPGHVRTMAELKPGLLSVHEGDAVEKWFVSSGFAFMHENSVADLVVLEGVPLDQIDAEEVKKGLAHYTQLVNTASTDLEKAKAQIGLEVHSAMSVALAA
ncbi:hypothetical protein Mapa_005267 [Marchantia paleacea]|nr:hypothetical protein Mapa_005267 [Marchantia paleacea]